MLITGLHAICDVHCTTCRAYLGWRYVRFPASAPVCWCSGVTPTPRRAQENAYEEDQRYKIGKVILEKAHLSKEHPWEDDHSP